MQFLQQLQQAFGYRAGVFQKVGQRQLYPLALKYSAEPSRHRVLLCGNSLHNLHPIAGQGFNLALRDIAAQLARLHERPPRGSAKWSASSVKNLLDRIELPAALLGRQSP